MKRIIVVIFLLIIGYTSQSQISLGFKGGVNFSKIRYTNKAEQEVVKETMQFRNDINAGLVNEIYFSKVLAVHTELLYSSKGYKYLLQFSEGHEKMNFLQINIGGMLENEINRNNYYYFIVSPYFGYWLFGRNYRVDSKTMQILDEKKVFKGELEDGTLWEYNRWDAGVILTAGLKHDFSRYRHGFVDFRYEYGLVSNEKLNVSGSTNRVFSINFGYLFTF